MGIGEITGMNLRNKLKDKIFEEKLHTHVELVRRKLDFEIIKDNHENVVTQLILDKFADTEGGLPGSNYKYQKIQALLEKHREMA